MTPLGTSHLKRFGLSERIAESVLVVEDARITADEDVRITADGDTRIPADA